MFVQTHFQRARHQAALGGANHSHSHSQGAGGSSQHSNSSSNHHHHSAQPSHSNSHKQHPNQNANNQLAATTRGKSAAAASHARTARRAPLASAGQQQVTKQSEQATVAHRARAHPQQQREGDLQRHTRSRSASDKLGGGLQQSDARASLVEWSTRPIATPTCHQDPNANKKQHNRARLRRASEFEESQLELDPHEPPPPIVCERERHLGENVPQLANGQQMGARVEPEAALGYSQGGPTRTSVRSPTESEVASHHLRLRSTSLSSSTKHSNQDATPQLDTVEKTSRTPQVERRERSHSRSATICTKRSPASLKLISAKSSRLAKSNRHLADHQLERVIQELVGSFVLVGRRLAPTSEAPELKVQDKRRSSTGTDQKFRHPALALLSTLNLFLWAPLKQTIHCLALFLVNFLAHQWRTLSQFALTAVESFIRPFEFFKFLLPTNKSRSHLKRPPSKIIQALPGVSVHVTYRQPNEQSSPMQASNFRRQSRLANGAPPPLLGAHSFDANRQAPPHEFAANPAHYPQRGQSYELDWFEPTQEPAAVGLSMEHRDQFHAHQHQHNHAAGLAAYYGRPADHREEQAHQGHLLYQHHQHQHNHQHHHLEAHGGPTFAEGLAARFAAQELASAASNHLHHHHQLPARTRSDLAPSPFAQPHRLELAEGQQLHNMHMRHTLDGWPSAEFIPAHRFAEAPTASAFQFHAPAQPVYQHLERHDGGLPAGPPPMRQRLASISSPTLSEMESSQNWWPVIERHPPAVVAAAVLSGYKPEVGPQFESLPSDWPANEQHQHQTTTYHHQQVVSNYGSSNIGNRARIFDREGPPLVALSQNKQQAVALGPPNRKLAERRLSSIIGSDSEIYARRPAGNSSSTANCNSSSSSSSLSSHVLGLRQLTNRKRFPAKVPHGQQEVERQVERRSMNHHQVAPLAREGQADRRRQLIRQASSTSATESQSRATTASIGQLARPPSVKQTGGHFNSSLQADEEPARARGLRAHLRLTKSDTESRSAGHSPSRGTAAPTSGARSAVKEAPAPPGRKRVNLASSGKSKSVGQQQQSPQPQSQQQHSAIGVLGKAVSLAGARRRLGFKQKSCGLNSLSVHRSEEILPYNHLQHGGWGRAQTCASGATTNSNSFNSDSGELELLGGVTSTSRLLSQFGQHSADPKVCFVEGLGLGQIASRQALVSPYLGDIQVSLSDRRGMLEVEVIRVRQLQPKAGAKRLPSPYAKVYLMRNKKCLAKFKTSQARQTLDPLYQQLFIFRDDYSNCVLQIIIWGDYGKKDRKSLMGIVQIHLDDLDISNMVIGWYKLFNAPSMVAAAASAANVTASSKTLRQTLSGTKLGDLATIRRQEESTSSTEQARDSCGGGGGGDGGEEAQSKQ